MLEQGQESRKKRQYKRLSDKDERVKEFLKRLEVMLRRIDRRFV